MLERPVVTGLFGRHMADADVGVSIETDDGTRHPMVGLLPCRVRMTDRLAMDYADVEVTCDTGVFPAGATIRGHIHHYSHIIDEPPPDVPRAFCVGTQSRPDAAEGYVVGSLLATYVHLHFGSSPEAARWFVERALRVRGH